MSRQSIWPGITTGIKLSIYFDDFRFNGACVCKGGFLLCTVFHCFVNTQAELMTWKQTNTLRFA